MTGWFREDGGPPFYGYSNRTSVTGDIPMVACCMVFFTLYIAFLIIYPGIRKQRFTTFVIVTLSLFMGNVITIAKLSSSWHVGQTEIESTYCASSKELLSAELGVYIGLDHVNVTLKALPLNHSEKISDIDYNERFYWNGVHEMSDYYNEALARGLPYPILTVAEYFSLSQEGFCWGAAYRAAGYYVSALLWAAFAFWLMMNVLMIVVPRYGAYAMIITSSLLLTTSLVYNYMLPVTPLIIRFEAKRQITFTYGWCFWLTLFSGIVSGFVGIIITCLDIIFPHSFSTILEVDFDTPYDRHIIIEESHYNRKKRSKKLEVESLGIGQQILRHLTSKRENLDDTMVNVRDSENRGFEMEAAPSPWHFSEEIPALKDVPHKMIGLRNLISSTESSKASVSYLNHLMQLSNGYESNSQYSLQTVSMW